MVSAAPVSEDLVKAVADEVMSRIATAASLAAGMRKIAVNVPDNSDTMSATVEQVLADKVGATMKGMFHDSDARAAECGRQVVLATGLHSVHPVSDRGTIAFEINHDGAEPLRVVLPVDIAGVLAGLLKLELNRSGETKRQPFRPKAEPVQFMHTFGEATDGAASPFDEDAYVERRAREDARLYRISTRIRARAKEIIAAEAGDTSPPLA